jgi:hypothetical protein
VPRVEKGLPSKRGDPQPPLKFKKTSDTGRFYYK